MSLSNYDGFLHDTVSLSIDYLVLIASVSGLVVRVAALSGPSDILFKLQIISNHHGKKGDNLKSYKCRKDFQQGLTILNSITDFFLLFGGRHSATCGRLIVLVVVIIVGYRHKGRVRI